MTHGDANTRTRATGRLRVRGEMILYLRKKGAQITMVKQEHLSDSFKMQTVCISLAAGLRFSK